MKEYPHIMIVDDEQGVRDLLKRVLEAEGYGVILAEDGRSALNLLKEHSPDLVLLDIMMPEVDGFQVLEYIRQYYNVPVIMITGKRETTAISDALGLGADDYVTKPFHIRELQARIRAKLRRVGLEVTAANHVGSGA